MVEHFRPLCVVSPPLPPLCFFCPLAHQNRHQGGDFAHFEKRWFKPWNSLAFSAKTFCPISNLKWNQQECLCTDFWHQMNTLCGYNQVHGQLSFWWNGRCLLLWMGAGAAPSKILIAMRRIDRLNCQSSRELASMEYCPCEDLEERTRLEWRQQLVGFGHKHCRLTLEHLSFSIYSENLETSLNSPGSITFPGLKLCFIL